MSNYINDNNLNKQNQSAEITILTSSLAATDVIAVHAGYKKYRKQLVASKINLHELKPTAQPTLSKTNTLIEGPRHASLHAKYMVVDQQYVFAGSASWSTARRLPNRQLNYLKKAHYRTVVINCA